MAHTLTKERARLAKQLAQFEADHDQAAAAWAAWDEACVAAAIDGEKQPKPPKIEQPDQLARIIDGTRKRIERVDREILEHDRARMGKRAQAIIEAQHQQRIAMAKLSAERVLLEIRCQPEALRPDGNGGWVIRGQQLAQATAALAKESHLTQADLQNLQRWLIEECRKQGPDQSVRDWDALKVECDELGGVGKVIGGHSLARLVDSRAGRAGQAFADMLAESMAPSDGQRSA